MTPHDTGSTSTPGVPCATAPPARTFGPQGPTLGELSDAYLQDYQNEILGLTWDELDEAGGVIRLSPARPPARAH